ncbi:hypothetical protein JTB14_000897 [Gonioctena quinquepunctata]|nr:hypothetical protein JTB14_000897 [Gonioctena quinquepunctata]
MIFYLLSWCSWFGLLSCVTFFGLFYHFLRCTRFYEIHNYISEEDNSPPPADKLNETKKSEKSIITMSENRRPSGQWILGDEDREEKYDDFPQVGDEVESTPPAAPSDGQGGHSGWSAAVQAELLERRKRLK